jgi:hypothetical protein
MAQHPPGSHHVGILDGNAVAGMLAPLWRVDPTVVSVTCAACGTEGRLAETVVEREEWSAIVRCRACTHTLLTVAETDAAVVLRVGGVDLTFPCA